MARGRFLSTSIATDDRLNTLSLEAQLLYLLTIPHLDRDGLFDGRPEVLWAAACPLRHALRDQVTGIIQEWIATGLVISYLANRTPVLYFPSFARHQSGMRYEREMPSKFPPPPGSRRNAQGLEPVDTTRSAASNACLPTTPATRRSDSGICRDQGEVQHQGEVQVEDQGEVQGEGQDQWMYASDAPMQNHHHQLARVRRIENTDDDGLFISAVEPAIERIAAYPLSTLRMAALDELKRIPDWVGSRQFVVRSDINRLASLLTWLRLYQILAGDRFRSDPRSVYYRTNAFADVNNPIGKIITQARDHTLAPLLPIDFDELLADLDRLSSLRNTSSEQPL